MRHYPKGRFKLNLGKSYENKNSMDAYLASQEQAIGGHKEATPPRLAARFQRPSLEALIRFARFRTNLLVDKSTSILASAKTALQIR